MDEEKVNQYAKKVAASLLKDAIKNAYMQGYNDAMEEVESKKPQDDSFVDLGLPSGTLIAKELLKSGDNTVFLTYEDSQCFDIIDYKTYCEISKYCNITKEKNGFINIEGPNGNKATLPILGVFKGKKIEYSSEPVIVWVAESEPARSACDVGTALSINYETGKFKLKTLTENYRCPVLLIKRNESDQ